MHSIFCSKRLYSAIHILIWGSPRKFSFNCFLKVRRALVWFLFQVRGPETRKARSPILVLVTGTNALIYNHGIVLYFTALHYNAVQCIAWHCVVLHSITTQYAALHCMTL